MNIHEYQAKEILKEHGASVSEGVVVFKLEEIDEKITLVEKNRAIIKINFLIGITYQK